ncbi:MAG: TetR family transcriptional regulator [Brooklawnia sp.]
MVVSRQSIVAAALDILDSYGLADLSMRRIGEALGVQAATIYWHYANKQTLLAGVSDQILAAQAEIAGTGLEAALREWATDLRSVLLAHRDAAELVAATLAVQLGERIPDTGAVQALRAAGWSALDAAAAARAITHFVLGHVVQEQTRQSLLGLGVLAPPVEALDEPGFELGLSMVVAGAGVLDRA